MSSAGKRRFVIAIVIILVMVCCAVAWTMRQPMAVRAPRVVARLIDGDTGQPIAGAKVKYTASIEKPHFYHGFDDEPFYTYATVTDADGRFVVPAWGPKPLPRGWHGNNFSPWVEVEKEGYSSAPKKYTSGTPWEKDWLGTAVISVAWADQQLIIHKIGRHPSNNPLDYVPWDDPH